MQHSFLHRITSSNSLPFYSIWKIKGIPYHILVVVTKPSQHRTRQLEHGMYASWSIWSNLLKESPSPQCNSASSPTFPLDIIAVHGPTFVHSGTVSASLHRVEKCTMPDPTHAISSTINGNVAPIYQTLHSQLNINTPSTSSSSHLRSPSRFNIRIISSS